MIVSVIILTIAFGSAFVLIGYEHHARMNGWPVGQWLSGDASFLKILSVITMLLSLILAFMRIAWWGPIFIFILGFIFGFASTQLLKYNVQFIAVFGTVIGWLLSILLVY